jgi:OOP family OmpA-OmpF porin
MKRPILAAPAILALAMSTAVPTAVADVPLTINAGLSRWFFTSDHDIDNMDAPMVGLEWAFNDKWALELGYSGDDTDDELFRGREVDVSAYNLGALRYWGSYVGKPNRIRPYYAVGVGYLEFDTDRNFNDLDDTATVNGGVGARWMITQRFGARLDYRVVYGFEDETTDSVLTAGLNYFFGNVTPPPPPEPVDSDGDGVPDDRDRCPGTPVGTRVDADGCPLAVAKVASVKLKVNFAFDSDKVEERFFADLGELAEFLKRFEDIQVDVEGHTDSIGPEDYNQQLSQRRAQAVVDLLVNEYGIPASRLQPVGYGENKPVASNDTEEGRAENRRVMATLEVEYEE